MAVIGLMLAAATAHAETGCQPGDTSLSCRLAGVLHWLEAMAVVLAFLLVLVVGVAVYVVRKNRVRERNAR